jgi:hypothetical protein
VLMMTYPNEYRLEFTPLDTFNQPFDVEFTAKENMPWQVLDHDGYAHPFSAKSVRENFATDNYSVKLISRPLYPASSAHLDIF